MIVFLLSILTAIESDYGTYHLFRLRFPFSLLNILAAYAVLFLCFPNDTLNDTLQVGKGLLFAQLVFIAAVFDAMTYEIPDWLHVLIVLVGFIRINLIDSVIGFFLISTLFLVLAFITGGGIGGGDIKLMAACGFVLGAVGIVLATFFSILLVLLFKLRWIFRREDRRKEFAMAPYLAAGCFFAYLLL